MAFTLQNALDIKQIPLRPPCNKVSVVYKYYFQLVMIKNGPKSSLNIPEVQDPICQPVKIYNWFTITHQIGPRRQSLSD